MAASQQDVFAAGCEGVWGSAAWHGGWWNMMSPGMVRGLSGVQFDPAHDKFFCLCSLGKKQH